jgi:hypothetical protein
MFLNRGWCDRVSRHWERRKLYPIDNGPASRAGTKNFTAVLTPR